MIEHLIQRLMCAIGQHGYIDYIAFKEGRCHWCSKGTKTHALQKRP